MTGACSKPLNRIGAHDVSALLELGAMAVAQSVLISMDCAEPAPLAEFWAAMLGGGGGGG